MPTQNEIRQIVTDKIIAALESGCPPWRKGWACGSGLPANVVSRRKYSGINIPLLQLAAFARGYTTNLWGTFRQWQQMGGQVKKRPADVRPGEFGVKVVYCSSVTKTRQTDDGDEKKDRLFFLKEYTVFNLDQVEGIDRTRFVSPLPTATAFVDYGPAEEVIAATKADIRFGGDSAYYRPAGDYIQLPLKAAFANEHEFYTTAYHELGHWSCAPHRLNWTGSYALGELVAEIGACYLAAETGVPQSDDMTNHHAYIAHWLRELQNDPRAIFRAASAASAACDMILKFSRPEEGVTEPEAEEAAA